MHHVPSVSRYNKRSFYFPEILNVSSEAADNIASLGHSFVVDWDASIVYIAYDTVEILKGDEMPGWLVLLRIGANVVCLVFWGTAEYWIKDRYKRKVFIRYFLWSMTSSIPTTPTHSSSKQEACHL